MSVPSASGSQPSLPPTGDSSTAKKPVREAAKVAKEKITKILKGKRASKDAPADATPRSAKRLKITKEADATTELHSQPTNDQPAVPQKTTKAIPPQVAGIIGSFHDEEQATGHIAEAFSVADTKAAYIQRQQELYNQRPEAENFLEYMKLKLDLDRQAAKQSAAGESATAVATASASNAPVAAAGPLTVEERFRLLESRYIQKAPSAVTQNGQPAQPPAVVKKQHPSIKEIPGLDNMFFTSDGKRIEMILQMLKDHCPALTTLRSYDKSNFSGKALSILSEMTQLTSLRFVIRGSDQEEWDRDFSNNLPWKFEEDKIAAALQKLTHLKTFHLESINAFIKEDFLQCLPESLMHLELVFNNTNTYGPSGSTLLDYSRFTKLETLTVISDLCSNQLIATIPPSLKGLRLNCPSGITDAQIQELCRRCQNLKSLTLKGFSDITDAQIQEIYKHCQNLESLSLDITAGITSAAILDALPKTLQILEINISNFPYTALTKLPKSLKVLKVPYDAPIPPAVLTQLQLEWPGLQIQDQNGESYDPKYSLQD